LEPPPFRAELRDPFLEAVPLFADRALALRLRDEEDERPPVFAPARFGNFLRFTLAMS
jgi:hypothetical protein